MLPSLNICQDTVVDLGRILILAQTRYGNKSISSTSTLKFLGLRTDDILTWKRHTEMIVSKLHAACFIITAVEPYMT
jgi:hypothetical protein